MAIFQTLDVNNSAWKNFTWQPESLKKQTNAVPHSVTYVKEATRARDAATTGPNTFFKEEKKGESTGALPFHERTAASFEEQAANQIVEPLLKWLIRTGIMSLFLKHNLFKSLQEHCRNGCNNAIVPKTSCTSLETAHFLPPVLSVYSLLPHFSYEWRRPHMHMTRNKLSFPLNTNNTKCDASPC